MIEYGMGFGMRIPSPLSCINSESVIHAGSSLGVDGGQRKDDPAHLFAFYYPPKSTFVPAKGTK